MSCPGPGLTPGTKCGRPPKNGAQELCRGHWYQQHAGKLLVPLQRRRTGCDQDGCDDQHYARGYCKLHYHRNREGLPMDAPVPARTGEKAPPRLCTVDGCTNIHRARGLCSTHYKHAYEGVTPKPAAPKRAARKRARPDLPPLEPWNPAELKHATTRAPKPAGGTGVREVGLIQPVPAHLVHVLQARLDPDLLAALGITPGDERIPIEEAA